ncbi:MAG TPA: hypothetical protein VK478_08375 [Gemmatimonadaceae bacterium]|nr:hypothetical protein [Gemmatimonadaceae bacterium]
MMDENEIRRRFAQLRESDRVGAPSFAQTYARARSRRASAAPRVSTVLIGVAAAILIVGVWQANSRSLSPSTTTAIATWRAPTDVLLRTPGSELLSTMPALNKSILDKMIPTPE